MSGIVTAFANDVSWETAFAQQVLGLAKPEDVLIALSTSGNSANCVAAAEVMKAMGGSAIAFTGAREQNGAIDGFQLCDPFLDPKSPPETRSSSPNRHTLPHLHRTNGRRQGMSNHPQCH